MGRGIKRSQSAGTSPISVRGQGVAAQSTIKKRIHLAIDSLEESLGVEKTNSGTISERAGGLIKKKFLETPIGSFIKRKYDSEESLASFVAFSAPALAAPLAVSQTLSQVALPAYAMIVAGAAVAFFLWRDEKKTKDYQLEKEKKKYGPYGP